MTTKLRIAIAWELGGGLGHVYPIVALANELRKRGHELTVALRESHEISRIALPADTVIEQSPIGDTGPDAVPFPTCLAHVLLNVGFCDAGALSRRVAQWCSILAKSRADIAVCDHSPTALLAAHCLRIRTARFGMGYCCPPDNDPQTRDLRPWRHTPESEVVAAEQTVLASVNQVLSSFKRPILREFNELFAFAEQTFLMTFRELDHFPKRENLAYRGPAPLPKAQPPTWPTGNRPRILAYLKPLPTLAPVLQHLQNLRVSTLVIGNELPGNVKTHFAAETLAFPSEMIDIQTAANDCDMTITHATHGVTAASLLAGKPVVMIPIVLEQAILAKRVIESGVGIWAYPHKTADITSAIDSVARNPVYRRRAEELATRYRGFDARESLLNVVANIETLANKR
jgi:hypothetical protein